MVRIEVKDRKSAVDSIMDIPIDSPRPMKPHEAARKLLPDAVFVSPFTGFARSISRPVMGGSVRELCDEVIGPGNSRDGWTHLWVTYFYAENETAVEVADVLCMAIPHTRKLSNEELLKRIGDVERGRPVAYPFTGYNIMEEAAWRLSNDKMTPQEVVKSNLLGKLYRSGENDVYAPAARAAKMLWKVDSEDLDEYVVKWLSDLENPRDRFKLACASVPLVRNPVDGVKSLYQHMYAVGIDQEKEFIRAIWNRVAGPDEPLDKPEVKEDPNETEIVPD